MIKPLYAKVVDINDPKKLGRIRCQIFSRTDGLPADVLPWYLPQYGKNKHDLPIIGETIEVQLLEDDIFFGYWRRIDRSDTMSSITDSDYHSAKVLLHEDLTKYDDEGIVHISYLKSIGVTIMYKESFIRIRPDQSVALYNKNKNWWVDVSTESISLGSETKSAEPGVLGDKNHDALDMLNDTIKEMARIIDEHMLKLVPLAMSNPYTSVLASTFTSLATNLKSVIESKMYQSNKDFFPKTKSEIVTLD